MTDLIWLSEAQMPRIEPYFPLSHGVPRVDDRKASLIAGQIRSSYQDFARISPIGPSS
jgi:hypothetical protein